MWQLSYGFNRAVLEPWRLAARAGAYLFNHPFNPLAYTLIGQSASLACRALERLIGGYGQSGFDMDMATPESSAKILPFVRPARSAG